MRPFEYFIPQSLPEACELLSNEIGARILAGGTDTLVELRKPSSKLPMALVDISRINDLKGIEENADSIVIKPLATHAEVFHSGLIVRYAALLRDAVAAIGSPQIRNRGTIGGNIMNAAACADTVPPLVALGATLTLSSQNGTRAIPISEFFLKPYQTVAQKNEILTEIRFPKLGNNSESAFTKLGRRNALSIARLSVAAILVRDKLSRIVEARIVPGAVFPRWQRVTEAEQLLIGQFPSETIFAEAGKKVAEVMLTLTGRRWSTEYKESVIAVLVRRTLSACVPSPRSI
jgi:CO/xanthine dehydrogenase FAD-binding subunit